MSDVLDGTSMLATCKHQVVHVGLVEFRERHDARTNRQQTAGRMDARGKLNDEVVRHARHPRSTLARMSRVSGMSARMSRGCYEETAVVEFKLIETSGAGQRAAGRSSLERAEISMRRGARMHDRPASRAMTRPPRSALM